MIYTIGALRQAQDAGRITPITINKKVRLICRTFLIQKSAVKGSRIAVDLEVIKFDNNIIFIRMSIDPGSLAI